MKFRKIGWKAFCKSYNAQKGSITIKIQYEMPTNGKGHTARIIIFVGITSVLAHRRRVNTVVGGVQKILNEKSTLRKK